MILGILTLFVAEAGAHPDDLVHPLPVIALMAVVVGTVVLGNLFPGKVSFLPAMRYYAGNWDTSLVVLSAAVPPSTGWTRTWSRRR